MKHFLVCSISWTRVILPYADPASALVPVSAEYFKMEFTFQYLFYEFSFCIAVVAEKIHSFYWCLLLLPAQIPSAP